MKLPQKLREVSGPRFGASLASAAMADWTMQNEGEALGQRIVVSGRYHHKGDQHDAQLDPNFTGEGRVMTDENGQYQFKTIKPGSYPWRNHFNAWRPAHIHFSLMGPAFVTRLVTQMYFP